MLRDGQRFGAQASIVETPDSIAMIEVRDKAAFPRVADLLQKS